MAAFLLSQPMWRPRPEQSAFRQAAATRPNAFMSASSRWWRISGATAASSRPGVLEFHEASMKPRVPLNIGWSSRFHSRAHATRQSATSSACLPFDFGP